MKSHTTQRKQVCAYVTAMANVPMIMATIQNYTWKKFAFVYCIKSSLNILDETICGSYSWILQNFHTNGDQQKIYFA